MPIAANWATPAGDQLVFFRQQPLNIFSQYIQNGSEAKEAGGILLGHVRGEHLEIVEATAPSMWDRRFRFLFERMPYFHHRVARKHWKESDGLIRYIGEWHTHPEDYPRPSSIDLREWKILAEGRSDGRPLLAVIVGCLDLHVEYMYASGQRSVLYV